MLYTYSLQPMTNGCEIYNVKIELGDREVVSYGPFTSETAAISFGALIAKCLNQKKMSEERAIELADYIREKEIELAEYIREKGIELADYIREKEIELADYIRKKEIDARLQEAIKAMCHEMFNKMYEDFKEEQDKASKFSSPNMPMS